MHAQLDARAARPFIYIGLTSPYADCATPEHRSNIILLRYNRALMRHMAQRIDEYGHLGLARTGYHLGSLAALLVKTHRSHSSFVCIYPYVYHFCAGADVRRSSARNTIQQTLLTPRTKVKTVRSIYFHYRTMFRSCHERAAKTRRSMHAHCVPRGNGTTGSMRNAALGPLNAGAHSVVSSAAADLFAQQNKPGFPANQRSAACVPKHSLRRTNQNEWKTDGSEARE